METSSSDKTAADMHSGKLTVIRNLYQREKGLNWNEQSSFDAVRQVMLKIEGEYDN